MKIPVPKPPPNAYNPNRPISDLIKSQLEHVLETENRLPHAHRSGQSVDSIKTEAEASDYIARVTARLRLPRTVIAPRPPKNAFNKRRHMSDLIRNQVLHFREVEMTWPEAEQTGINAAAIKSEHQASAYIARITARLHEMGGAPSSGGPNKSGPSASDPDTAPSPNPDTLSSWPRAGDKPSRKKPRKKG
jgi:hypothetical protein